MIRSKSGESATPRDYSDVFRQASKRVCLKFSIDPKGLPLGSYYLKSRMHSVQRLRIDAWSLALACATSLPGQAGRLLLEYLSKAVYVLRSPARGI